MYTARTRLSFASALWTPLWLGYRCPNPAAYDRLINKGDYSVFTTEVKGSKEIKNCFVETFGRCIKPDDYRSMVDDENRIDEFIDAVAALRWTNQFDKKNAAYKTIDEVENGYLIPMHRKRVSAAPS